MFLLTAQLSYAQTDSLKALRVAVGVEAALYSGSLYGLNKMWYSGYPKSSFHWHNDNNAWFQMDKVGHATTAYQVGLLGMNLMEWGSVSKRKAIWYGGAYGAVFLTTIEVLDGFSEEWGASWGDLIANTSGSALLIGQELLWEEQRVQVKYSFYPSEFAQQSPDLLGTNRLQQSIKDYNGQTYWLSANLHSFMPESKLPKWLNVAMGYGANGMISGTPTEYDIALAGCYAAPVRYRQFYFGLDVDLRKIDTGKPFWNKVLKLVSFIKIPAPAIGYDKSNGITYYPMYYGQ